MKNLLEKLQNAAETVEFAEVMVAVEANYIFTETSFTNGDLRNEAGQNSGSCKVFSFAKLQNLSEEQTLACFGIYYRNDVLQNPEGTDHQNIRNFMKTGWAGISFDGDALQEK